MHRNIFTLGLPSLASTWAPSVNKFWLRPVAINDSACSFFDSAGEYRMHRRTVKIFIGGPCDGPCEHFTAEGHPAVQRLITKFLLLLNFTRAPP